MLRSGFVGTFGRLAAVLIVFSVAAGAAFVFSHRRVEEVSADQAAAEFQRLRARWAGTPALVDMNSRQLRTPTGPQNGTVHTFHTVIFDTRGGNRLVSLSVPAWFGSLFGRNGFHWLGQLTFLDDTEFDPEPIELSLKEVNRRGAGLLVDFRHPTGGQFLSWTE